MQPKAFLFDKDRDRFQPYLTLMENIVTYSGGGGSIYCRDARSTYLAMRDDPMRQRIEGFGEWEILRLLAPTLTCRILYNRVWKVVNVVQSSVNQE